MSYFPYMLNAEQMLIINIQSLREKMIQIGLKEGLQSQNTIELSQKLDNLLNIYQALNND